MNELATFSAVERFGEDLSSSTLRSDFFPSPQYGVSVHFHKAGSQFSQLMYSALIIVRTGRIEMRNRQNSLAIGAGEYSEVPGGEYSVFVKSSCDAETVYVYDLDEIGSKSG